MCKSQEDRGDYFGLNSESLFVRILYAYRVHIVFTGTHFMHLQTSYLWISHLNYRSVKGQSLPFSYQDIRQLLLTSSIVTPVFVKGKGQ